VRSSIRAVLLALITAIISVALASGTLVAPPSASAGTSREASLLARVNAARTSHGLHALASNRYLADYARAHARQMAERGGLFHTANFNVVCCWTAVGENIAWNGTVNRVHVSLMNSPPHRANILNGNFRQVGIGIVKYRGQLWVTQVFRRHS
jgi:serralysin